MKHYSILLSALVLLACCTNENELMPNKTESGKVVLKATIENHETRANYYVDGDKARFFWTEGDNIEVALSDGSTAIFNLIDGAGTPNGVFEGYVNNNVSIADWAEYRGRHINGWSGSGDRRTGYNLSEYNYCWGSGENFPSEASPYEFNAGIPMYAKIEGDEMVFKMITGVLGFRFVNMPEYSNRLEIISDQNVSGHFDLDWYSESPSLRSGGEDTWGNLSKYRYVYFDSSDDYFTRAFYLPVPCGEYQSFTINLYDQDDNIVYSNTSEKTRVINRGDFLCFDDIVVAEVEDGEIITEHLTDSLFREYIVSNFDRNGDGEISEREAIRVRTIEYDGYRFSQSLKSLNGIEYFKNLDYIWITNNRELTSADLSQNPKLRRVNLGENALEYIDVSGCSELEWLHCNNNEHMSSLNLSGCYSLQELSCHNNSLTELDLSNCIELRSVDCENNLLTILDVSNNLNLEYLNANNNPLKEVIVSPEQDTSNFYYEIEEDITDAFEDKAFLNYLFNELCIDSNGDGRISKKEARAVTYIELTAEIIDYSTGGNGEVQSLKGIEYMTNLNYLSVTGQQLETVDLSNNRELWSINLSFNHLTSLDLSNCTHLRQLFCHLNQIKVLDIRNSRYLEDIMVSGNPLETLYLHIAANVQLNNLPSNVEIIYNGDRDAYTGDAENSDPEHVEL